MSLSIMENKLKVGVTTVAFSKNQKLRQALQAKGFDCRFNDAGKRFTREELIEFLKDLDGAIVGLDLIDDEVLKHCPKLKVVSKYGVGLDNIDFEACEKYGVRVAYTPGVNKRSVAEEALGFMLGLCRNLFSASQQLKAGAWVKNGGVQLTGKTVGVIGVGNIGREVVRLLGPFQCRILVNDIVDVSVFCEEYKLLHCDKDQIFREADIVTIHTPLTELTRYMVNAQTLALMKSTAYLVNTARGGIVDEAALKVALMEKWITAAALDVFEEEPPSDQGFLQLENLICTPHVAGNAREAVELMGESAIDNLTCKLLGKTG